MSGPCCVITGIGLRCAVGQDSLQSCAAVRAGVSGFLDWEHAALPSGDADGANGLIAAPVTPDLGDQSWMAKFPALAVQPLLEALWMAGLSHLTVAPRALAWSVIIAVPELDRADIADGELDAFRDAWDRQEVFPFAIPAASFVHGGHAGGLVALDQAMAELQAGRLQVAVVGGVDSLLNGQLLAELADAGRLKNGQVPSGLIPGEAGTFAVIETLDHAHARKATPLAALGGVVTGHEASHTAGDRPSRAEAVGTVLRTLLAQTPCDPGRIERVINDLNGERWRFLEWALADGRALSGLPPEWQLWTPADSFGDIGSATGAAHLCLAARAHARGYAAGPAIPICNSSDTGQRAAVVVLPCPGEP